MTPREVAEQLGLKPNTVQKAVGAGRLHAREKKKEDVDSPGQRDVGSTKSERTAQDAEAPMGMGATNTTERILASVGKLHSASIEFRPAVDVANGGVLFAIPALLANGLLSHTRGHFELPPGYYGIDSIFLLLAFMALCRIRQPEQLRYCPPGEWGKLLGLDRIPEVRTLRGKLTILSGNGQVDNWGATLCSQWMAESPEGCGVLYVDGHVRVYHGSKVTLPRHYVARERLCLRATADYWVNAMDGQPFFLVTQAVDPGLITVLEEQILPRLEQCVASQPTAEQLEENPKLHRFTLVFDREGYSPELMARLKAKSIACITYRKRVKDTWPENEFTDQVVPLVGENWMSMKLAERRVTLSNGLEVREVRRLCAAGHQTSVVSTDEWSNLAYIAARMFARWCQENFFRYMRQQYSLDRLVDYDTQSLPDTTQVVNPAYRAVDSQVRTVAAELARKRSAFCQMNLTDDIKPGLVERFEVRKADLRDEILALDAKLDTLKAERKKTPPPHHRQGAGPPTNSSVGSAPTRSTSWT